MRRVLLVDDSQLIRNSMQSVLEPLGLEIGHAENGKIGSDKALASSWDLIFLDVVMPVMDGPGALRTIRASGNTTPVVLVTSVSTAAVVSAAVKLGGVHYISKPFTRDQIRNVATKLLKLDPAAAIAPAFVLLQHTDPALHEQLRKLLPAQVEIDSAENLAQSLDLAECGARDLVLIDSQGLSGNPAEIAGELRGILPAAGIFALADAPTTPRWQPVAGLDGVLPRAIDAALVRELLMPNFLRPLVGLDGMVARAAGFVGPPIYMPAYLAALERVLIDRCSRLDATGDLRIDLTRMPNDVDAVVALIAFVNTKLRDAGAAPSFQVNPAVRAEAGPRLSRFVLK